MKTNMQKGLCFFMALSVIFAGSTLFYGFESKKNEQYIEYSNQRAFSQLIESMSALDSALQKIRFASSGTSLATLSAQIWRESAAAKSALSALPLNISELQSTEKFISQAGDYAYSVLRTNASGLPQTKEHQKSIDSLAKTANLLSEELSSVKSGLNTGMLSYSSELDNSISQNFSDMEQEFPAYATLIYDGPFSEHISKRKPALTANLPAVTEEQAMQNAAWFLGIEKTALSSSETGGDVINYYRFSTNDGKGIDITRNGGIVLASSIPREIGTATISSKDGVAAAQKFLKTKGFDGMKQTYYTIYENIMTINFAYFQNDIMVYPDLIKLNVALDNGEIVGFDARGYIMSHQNRRLEQPKISVANAQSKLSPTLTVKSVNIALIPTSGQGEVLCHEFVCTTKDKLHVIVYINALTGIEENILILLESESGTLTI